MQLPHSGLTIRASTIYWRGWTSSEDRPWVSPDIPVALSSRDYQFNHDPVLQAALDYQPAEKFSDRLSTAFANGGFESAIRHAYRHMNDPRTANMSTEEEVNQLGRRLTQEKRFEEAMTVFQLNLYMYSQSAEAYAGLGEVYSLIGQTDEAIQHYEQSVALDPKNRSTSKRLEKLKKQAKSRTN